MWVLVIYEKEQVKMYEFQSKDEAQKAAKDKNGYAVLTQVA